MNREIESSKPPVSQARCATAIAPPTVGNVAVGFDMLGHALQGQGDRVTITRTDRGCIRITAISGAVTSLPTNPQSNTAGLALLTLLQACPQGTGFDIEIEKGIALGSGMGGSAASAAAAVMAANATLETPLDFGLLYHAAKQGESAASGSAHGDNVAPALLGGLVIAPTEGIPIRVPVPTWLHAAVVRPHLQLNTRESRAVLQAPYELATFVHQSEHLALLLAGCYTSDASLIRRGLRDVLVEPRRAQLIPGFARVQQAAMDSKALGASISGAGPSVFGWFESREAAQSAAAAMQHAFHDAGLGSDPLVSEVNAPGTQVIA